MATELMSVPPACLKTKRQVKIDSDKTCFRYIIIANLAISLDGILADIIDVSDNCFLNYGRSVRFVYLVKLQNLFWTHLSNSFTYSAGHTNNAKN